jgi:hydrogenase nickel incorporation protein HypA/HybF
MHESYLVRSLIKQLKQLVPPEDSGRRVRSIRVRISEGAGVAPEVFCRLYDELTLGTALDDIEVDLHPAPLQATCARCGIQFAVQRYRFLCPSCGGSRLTIHGGDEMALESISIEEAEPCEIST